MFCIIMPKEGLLLCKFSESLLVMKHYIGTVFSLNKNHSMSYYDRINAYNSDSRSQNDQSMGNKVIEAQLM